MNMFIDVYRGLVAQVKEINTRYSKPHIEMTLFVRICLLCLRFYLFLLVGLLIYKFVTAVRQ